MELKKEGYQTGILSNGSQSMLASAVKNAGIESYLDKILSVEICEVYKPSKKVYELVENKFQIIKMKWHFFQVTHGICTRQLILDLKQYG